MSGGLLERHQTRGGRGSCQVAARRMGASADWDGTGSIQAQHCRMKYNDRKRSGEKNTAAGGERVLKRRREERRGRNDREKQQTCS